MASSFKLFTDSGLTTVYDGTESFLHYSDGSDNPQVVGPLYFGSAETAGTRSLKAASNPGIDDVVLTPTLILSTWVGSTSYSLGNRVVPTVADGYVYEVTSAGTSGGSEPTWPASIDSTVADGTVVWTCVALDHDITEIKLNTSNSFGGITPGAALSLGSEILSGSANAVTIYMQVTNSVSTISDNIGNEELAVNINTCNEYAV